MTPREASPTIVWYRRDLRIADNAALSSAIDTGRPVIPVFIWAREEDAPWQPGVASRWWLHHSLKSLAVDLGTRGSRLVIRQADDSLDELRRIIAETGADTVMWNRLYEPSRADGDRRVADALRRDGLEVVSFEGALLFEPSEVLNRAGAPFQVFTPFWKHCLTRDEPPSPIPAPAAVPPPSNWPWSAPLADLGLIAPDDHQFSDHWVPGESAGWNSLDAFLGGPIERYGDDRDRPDLAGTSRLSPHLHFGEITARQLWHVLGDRRGTSADKFLSEVGWREFAHQLLHHFPHTADQPLRPEFTRFPWRTDPEHLEAWHTGQTGYPLVDAGMRQLRATGWMHNRVRMVVASFLVKHLRIHWLEGARWFWDTLVDADLANNTFGWQWTAGSGADAAPYLRVFNPTLQGERFDPDGGYIRRWVPELSGIPQQHLYQPWRRPPASSLEYPDPIVDHADARTEALLAFEALRRASP
ncbi:MAG: deoxyribodipyrimidine photo-lyase [Acidimicrobiia bacterium]